MSAQFSLGLVLVFASASLGWIAAVCYHRDFRPFEAAHVVPVKLKVVKVDSEETKSADDNGEKAVDGNPNTYWHTQWSDDGPGLPHEIIIELDPPSVIKGFAYLPRQDVSDHGTIKDFEFYVSKDGKNFGRPVKKGAFAPGKEEKIETFKPVKCHFIKLKALSEITGQPWTSAAEIRVIQRGELPATKEYRQGNTGPISSQIDSSKPEAVDSFVADLSSGLHSFADTNILGASMNVAVKPQSSVVADFMSILQKNGDNLGCHFTVEYQGDGITGRASPVNMPVRTNLDSDSITSLVSNLRNYLGGSFAVVQDAKNPKIVHIIEKVLAEDPNYVLNKKINLNYFGSLDPTNVPDGNRPGYAIPVGGLLSAAAERAGRIIGGSRDSTFLGQASDRGVTRISVNATNETVRSILTDCLPANYNPVMWRAETAIMPGIDGNQWVLVQFFGQKKL